MTEVKTPCDKIQCYDPCSDTWTLTTMWPAPQEYPRACAFNGQILILFNDHEWDKRVDMYDVAENRWARCTDIPQFIPEGDGCPVVVKGPAPSKMDFALPQGCIRRSSETKIGGMSVRVLCEVRPRVQACNVTATAADLNCPMKFTVQPNSLQVSCRSSPEEEQLCSFNLPENFSMRFQPKSLSGLTISNDSVSFRLQTEPHQDITGSFSAQVLMLDNDNMNFAILSRAPRVRPDQVYNVECGCCGSSLLSTPTITFRRVLPLPSSVCDANDFFCHKHSNDGSTEPAPMATDPRSDDCFYSTALLRLNKSIFSCQQSEVLRCKRCLAWLGTHDKNSTTLWTCTSVIRPVSDNTAFSEVSDAVQDFVDIVKEAVRESMSIACRIVLEARSSPGRNVYLLLWVLDRNLITLSAHTNLKNVPSCVTLVERKIAKVLFVFQTRESQLLSSWLNDSRVQSVNVALPILIQGLGMLVKTSRLLPSTGRTGQNGFFIGYLCPDLIK